MPAAGGGSSAYRDDQGVTDAGLTHRLSTPIAETPSLTIRLISMNAMATIWSSVRVARDLQQNTHSVRSLNWRNVTATIQDDGTTKTLIVTPTAGSQFYRLRKL